MTIVRVYKFFVHGLKQKTNRKQKVKILEKTLNTRDYYNHIIIITNQLYGTIKCMKLVETEKNIPIRYHDAHH